MTMRSDVKRLPRCQWIRSRAVQALALAGLLAGCATVVPPQASKAPPPVQPVAPPAEQHQQVATQLPQDSGRHRVALLVPITGAHAGVGEALANAANMAVIDTGGKNIRVTTYDTNLGAARATEKALADGNELILGPLFADEVRSVAPIARAAHVPVVSFSNDTGVAGNGVWIMGFTPTQSINRVVAYARSQGATQFGGVAQRGLYGERANTALLRAAEHNGAQVVSVQNYTPLPSDLALAATKLAAAGKVDAVLIADNGRFARQIAPILRRKLGPDVHFLGTDLWDVEHGLGTVPALRGAWYAGVSDALYSQLAVKYRARFHKAPYRYASLGYDSVLLATNIANEWRVGGAFPINKLIDKGGFVGIDGVFRFTRDGIAERGLQIAEVTATGTTVVSPAPKSLGN